MTLGYVDPLIHSQAIFSHIDFYSSRGAVRESAGVPHKCGRGELPLLALNLPLLIRENDDNK